ncbi:acyltransferase [Leptospira weilii serovar Ranarum str. ICFT]|uniref:Acyltransferase n=1 Tax=Leptospira weilii serovar Ranarum str. ICFT TaxID=1218598 RepID=N1WB66_9LEPT|nr:acyltransferase family protein [Leptospira weilii]EMY76190.1 acyltransferase [Leptospira weilii serovar Ranarum str. ICFT]
MNQFLQNLFKIPTNKEYRPDIDGLRAVAILLVVAYHTVPYKFKGGFIGVDIFFVISGYLISNIVFKSLESDTFSFKDFYLKRIKRIFPALLVLFAFILTYGYFYLLANDLKTLSKHIIAGVLFLSNIIYWSETGYFNSGIKYLLHLWSLGIEEQFYILWPVILFVIYKYRINSLTVLCVLWVFSFLTNLLLTGKDLTSAFFLPQGRFWELMTGSILAYVTVFKKEYLNYKFSSLLNHINSFVGLVLIGLAFYWINQDQSFPGWWALLPTTGSFLLISAGKQAIVNKYLLSNRLFVIMGLISYPLYLWHWPLLTIAGLMDYENSNEAKLIRVSAVLISFIFSFITYRWIEIPIRNVRLKEKNVLIVRSLVLLMISFLSISTFIYYKNGFIDNYPKIVFELDQYKHYETKEIFRSGTCLLQDQDKNSFSKDCLDPEEQNSSILFVWGDSYAAQLIHGLKILKTEKKFRIAQYSSAACPPIFEFETSRHPLCRSTNQYIGKELIPKLNPSLIVLSAYWPAYFFPREVTFAKDLSRFKESIISLKRDQAENLVLIGPLPEWEGGLPNVLIKRIVFDKKSDIPERMIPQKFEKVVELDKEFRKLSKELDIVYISPIDYLCNVEGCITRVGDTTDSLIAFDHGHLTQVGTEFFIRKIFPKLNIYLSKHVE